jgi:hypothetical protein
MRFCVIHTIVALIAVFVVFCMRSAHAQESPDTVKIEIEKTVYDTLQVVDTTIIYDTVFVEQTGPYKSIGICGGVNYPVLRFPSEMDADILDKNKTFLTHKPGYSVGADLRFDWQKWSAETGLFYSRLKSDFVQTEQFWVQDTNYHYMADSTQVWNVDTVDVYYQESGGDTITIYVTDSSQQWESDSTMITDIDSVQTDSLYLYSNQYHCLDLPVIITWPFLIRDDHFFSIKAGFIGSLILKQDAIYITETGRTLFRSDMRFTGSAVLGLSWEHYVGEYLGVELSASYRYHLLNEFSRLPDGLRFRAGLRYYF